MLPDILLRKLAKPGSRGDDICCLDNHRVKYFFLNVQLGKFTDSFCNHFLVILEETISLKTSSFIVKVIRSHQQTARY